MIPNLGIYSVFLMEPFYPWLLMLAVSATSLVFAVKS